MKINRGVVFDYITNRIIYNNKYFRSVPSKIDIAVLNALPETIDPEVYPLIYQWKHDLQLAVRKNDIR